MANRIFSRRFSPARVLLLRTISLRVSISLGGVVAAFSSVTEIYNYRDFSACLPDRNLRDEEIQLGTRLARVEKFAVDLVFSQKAISSRPIPASGRSIWRPDRDRFSGSATFPGFQYDPVKAINERWNFEQKDLLSRRPLESLREFLIHCQHSHILDVPTVCECEPMKT